jgi:hypothetical protein
MAKQARQRGSVSSRDSATSVSVKKVLDAALNENRIDGKNLKAKICTSCLENPMAGWERSCLRRTAGVAMLANF